MKMKHFLQFVSVLISFNTFAQVRPNTIISQQINGVCVGCNLDNLDYAYDNNLSSYATLGVGVAGLAGTGEVVYQFANPVAQYHVFKIMVRFQGTSLISGLVEAEVFKRISIQLQNSAGTPLQTYDANNLADVSVLSYGDNLFELTIINPTANTRRIKLKTGDLLGLGLLSRDLLLYNIQANPTEIYPVTTNEAVGKTNAVLCIACSVLNKENATTAADINSSYASFNIPLSLNLGSGYIYSRYTWNGSTYSGSDYDAYIVLENDNLLTVGTELLFFDNGNISFEVTYSDGSTEVIKNTDTGLLTASLLAVGGGKFYIKLNLKDGKEVKKIETRFGGSLLSALNTLRLYSIFLSQTNPFLETDIPAVYTIGLEKPVSDYLANEVLASVLDANGPVKNATVSSGSLPVGTSLAVDGTIKVGNPSQLVAGSYSFSVTTTDVKGGVTNNPITIKLGAADIEAIYTVNGAKPVNDYVVNDALATVSDANGAIVNATINVGLLPLGTSLSANGTISVTNTLLLLPGTYPLTITTTDAKGGQTQNTISLQLNPLDIEAVYVVNPIKPVDEYKLNDVLAIATDVNGPIISASVTTGSLPPGTSLATNGTISVTTPSQIVAGTYPVQITTKDSKGGTSVTNLSLVVYPADIEAVYTVNPAKPVTSYVANDVLASVTDANGPVVLSVLVSGLLPLGTLLNLNGTIQIITPLLLVPNTYPIQVLTTDALGGLTLSSISITINPIDVPAIYTVNPAKPVTDYLANAVLATATDANGPIVSATIKSGTLPNGVTLSSNGNLVVTNPTLLPAGLTPLEITTTDNKGGVTTSQVTITLNPVDIEAIYTVNTPKPVNDYTASEILASVSDANGAIGASVIVSGILPLGTSLSLDGSIKVTNPSLLIPGTYPLQILTTDILNGTTTNSISLTIQPGDIEAVYSVLPPKPINDYKATDVIAFATDANGLILSASLISNVLPAGLTLANNGAITVSNPLLLVAGTYPITVKTTDLLGGTSSTAVSIVLNPTDIEAIYTVSTPKPLNAYASNDVLATVSDQNGAIISAIINLGILPLGASIGVDGNIKVTNPALLLPGTYPLKITTTDNKNGTTLSDVVLVIHSIDLPAVYTINAPKPVNDYANNEVLASVTDPNGPIVSASVSAGSLPAGVSLSTNGALTVSNPSLLVSGTYSFKVVTIDNHGGSTESSLSLTLNPTDIEAIYTVNPAKPANDYQLNAVLASATDANGTIVSSTINSGSLPLGAVLEGNGTIRLLTPTLLAAGTYPLQITTTDEKGGKTLSSISIQINPIDLEAVYVVPTPIPLNTYVTGTALATVTDANGAIVNAQITSGNLPAGTSLNLDGSIKVTNTTLLVAGTYPLQILTTDVANGTTSSSIAVTIGAQVEVDFPAVYVVKPAKPVNTYLQNEVLATVSDPNGPIVSATVTSGTLPAGITLNADGQIQVTNPSLLQAGTYPIEITTKDSKGGTSKVNISLVFKAQDVPAVYTVLPSKPINDYLANEALATVTDANGKIISSIITTGILPIGLALDTNGTIKVFNKSLLVSASTPLVIRTIDEQGGVTVHNITLTLHPTDIEAIYTLRPFRPVTSYITGDTLATIVDGNGAIVSAQLITGTLPNGTSLGTNGIIKVSNASLLQAGSYPLQITTTDAQGGVTTQSIQLTFHTADIAAVYTINPAKPINDYVAGEILATATDANGPIVSAIISSGALPAGMKLENNGSISVLNTGLLQQGTYSLEATTTDDKGGVTKSTITLVINNQDIEAVYLVSLAKPLNGYLNQETIAQVTDANGAIVSATITSGTLPPGTVLGTDGNLKISNQAQLIAGSYPLTIKTTDILAGSTISNITIQLNPTDIPAVYTRNLPKQLNDYASNDTLAKVTDVNGPIILAELISGSLPNGTVLDTNGLIKVINPTSLIAGTYTLVVSTQDNKGGVTNSTVELVLHPADIEAIYVLTPSKPINDYVNNAVLASATDGNGAIVSSVLNSGTLPTGIALAPNATITVLNQLLLVAGSYPLEVLTTDVAGGTTLSSITVTLNKADREAVYAIKSSKAVNDYLNADTLATVSDPDGNIIAVSISTGVLPSGTSISNDGTITVSASHLLLSGTYNLQITTTDQYAGVSTNSVTLTIYPADIEAIYMVKRAKPVNDYNLGDALATATDSNGVIISATLTNGTLPTEAVLLTDGTIQVSNKSLLAAGTYPFEVATVDEKNGKSISQVVIVIHPEDIEAQYTVFTSLSLNEYLLNDSLAKVTDANGHIVLATLTTGTLPIGTSLQGNGTILVEHPTLLVAGTYPLTVTTTDEMGGISVNTISLVLKPTDLEAVYTLKGALPINMYTNTFTLAEAVDGDGAIIKTQLLSGTLPAGTLLEMNSLIKVVDSTQLQPGSYPLKISTEDEKGGTSILDIIVLLKPVDQNASYTVAPSKLVFEYTDNEKLALAMDPDGAIVASTLTAGTLPIGTVLDNDGTIRVVNHSLLTTGAFPISILTTDQLGGTTTNKITLEIIQVNVTAGVTKSASTPVLQQDGSYKVEYLVSVKNMGNAPIHHIRLADNLSAAFPSPATYSVLPGIVGTGDLHVDSSFDGASKLELLKGTSTLAVGTSSSVKYVVIVQPNQAQGKFYNSATVFTTSQDGKLTFQDLSNNGNDPDPNGNGNPKDPGEDVPTPITLYDNPIIGLAKSASSPLLQPDGSYLVSFTLTLKNLGNINLTNVQVTDDLLSAFPAPVGATLSGAISTTGSLSANTEFDGITNKNLLRSGGLLSVGETQIIKFKLKITLSGSNISFFNSASASALGGGISCTDISTNGTDPDPNGNGNPSDLGEDTKTPVTLTPNMVVGLSKSVGIPVALQDGSFRISYLLTVVNYGNTVINKISVTDDLLKAFPVPLSFALSTAIVTNGGLVPNTAFDGIKDINLLAPSSKLGIGETETIELSLVIKLNGGLHTLFYNSATVTATSDDNLSSYVDVSNDGNNPDPNNDGDPNGPGENVPTPVQLIVKPIIGLANGAATPIRLSDGSYDISYSITVANMGSVILSDVQLKTDLSSTFPSPVTYTVKDLSANSALKVNTTFDGKLDKNLLQSGNTLAFGTSEIVSLKINVKSGTAIGPFYNTVIGTASAIGSIVGTSDISANGLDPDPNKNGNPCDVNESDPTPVNLQPFPCIGIAKSASLPILQADSSFEVTFTLNLENLGNTDLHHIAVNDKIAETFPTGVSYQLVNRISTTGHLAPDTTYNGNSKTNLLAKGNGVLKVGETESIQFTLKINSNGKIGPFYNSAVAFASNADSSITYQDISTNGTDPDPNGNSNPNDATESIPTPITLKTFPSIGILNHSVPPVLKIDGTYDISFVVTIVNMGNEVLKNIKVESDLKSVFQSPTTIKLVQGATATGRLVVNPTYDGISDTHLLLDGILDVNEKQTVTYSINIDPRNRFGTFWQQLKGYGQGFVSDLVLSNMSTNMEKLGMVIIPSGPKKPTPINLVPDEGVELFEHVSLPLLQSNCSYNATYTIYVENKGNTTLQNLQITNDLQASFPSPATFSVTSVSSTSGLTLNPNFNGKSSLTLLAGGDTLLPEGKGTIQLVVNIQPNGSYGPFRNQSKLMSTTYSGGLSILSKDGIHVEDSIVAVFEPSPTFLTITPNDIFVPGGFSPNGDGDHDYFEVTVKCGLTANLKVFNRWGDKVYSSANYNNDWDGTANHGSFMNKFLPDGTYFYTVELSNGSKLTDFLTIKR